MSIGKQKLLQNTMWVAYDQIPKGPGHEFYDHLQRILHSAHFDAYVQDLCAPFYAKTMGRPSIPPGRYFRMLLVGYFEGLDSERGICWRCADSLSLREFIQLDTTQAVPDHSSLSRIRTRLPLAIHHEVFIFVLRQLSAHGLLRGKKLGIDTEKPFLSPIAAILIDQMQGPYPELPELQKNLPLEDYAKFYKGKKIEGHMQNFVTCIREGGEPVSDVDSTVQVMNVCHLLGISARLNREIVWDPKTEKTGDAESMKFLAREQRKGYENPTLS